jgi:hypothetical protein
MGTPDRRVAQMALGIRNTAHRHFEAEVVPLVEQHWPATIGSTFYAKLRIGACDLYASAPYTAMFCAPERPALVRAVTLLGNAVRLPPFALPLLGRLTMELLGRYAYRDEHRRIILVAAFVVVVDHVFDHCMKQPGPLRAEVLIAVIDGTRAPESDELRLVRALVLAMGRGLGPADQACFDAAMSGVRSWIHAEVRAMEGQVDPLGLGHRLAGVEGTIDGLLFPVARFGCVGARSWMVQVSMFVQIMDDWLDLESDARSDRPTPVTEGAWGYRDLARAWQQTLDGLESLVREADLSAPHYVAFVRSSYVCMMHDVMEAMVERPDQ